MVIFVLFIIIMFSRWSQQKQQVQPIYDLFWPSPIDEIPFWKKDSPAWDMNSEHPVDIEKDSNLLHVVHVMAEMALIAKVGGLGDVVTGLAHACLSCGHKIDVMPFP